MTGSGGAAVLPHEANVGNPPSTLRALVVDDDTDINRLIGFRLQRRGLGVDSARNGEEALERIAASAPDLLFLDVSMPGISGLEVLDVLRRDGRDLAVVITTAFGSEQIAADALRRGADDYLRKPFESGEFQALFERVTSRLQLRRENAALRRELDFRLAQLNSELARAAEVQADLLPEQAPTVAGYNVAARCISAREVGGDFYYWAPRADGSFDVAFGDVMGKGMPAALLMATVRASLQALLPALPLDVAVTRLSRLLDADLARSGSFVTLFALRLDPAEGHFDFVDAGHGLAILSEKDGCARQLRSSGLPIGVVPGQCYAAHREVLDHSATLLLCSDGFLDRDAAFLGNLLGPGGFSPFRTATDFVDEVLPSGCEPGTDDLTLLAITRDPAP
jgi:sigma-B regulation protein RsbU (phosphoserine phosphatase)